MNRGRAICETAHLALLGLWLGALVMTGATAAVVFTEMKSLTPALPAYAAYTGEHWALAGGRVMQRVFFFADAAQFICGLGAALTLLLSVATFGLSVRRVSTLVRGALVFIAVALAAYAIIGLGPRMNSNLRAYWSAAERGDMEDAARPRAAFDADHPVASAVMSATAAAVLLALIAGAWSVARQGASSLPPAPERKSAWEEPELLKVRR